MMENGASIHNQVAFLNEILFERSFILTPTPSFACFKTMESQIALLSYRIVYSAID